MRFMNSGTLFNLPTLQLPKLLKAGGKTSLSRLLLGIHDHISSYSPHEWWFTSLPHFPLSCSSFIAHDFLPNQSTSKFLYQGTLHHTHPDLHTQLPAGVSRPSCNVKLSLSPSSLFLKCSLPWHSNFCTFLIST